MAQNGIFSVFGHFVTLTYDIWNTDFQKCWSFPKYVLLIIQSSYLVDYRS